jgi:hypothetical protein
MNTKYLQVPVSIELLEGIDSYRRRQVGEIPSKAAAVRELLELALRVDANESVELS